MSGTADIVFLRGGEMAAEMRSKDWRETPLGVPDTWPQSLRTALQILLTSRYAMWMAWGPELTFFCNDAYRPTLGVKQAWALGSRAQQVWAEIWPDIGPRIERVLTTGEATWDEGLLLFLERSGYPEETYHTFSYSPLSNDDGTVSGMLCVVTEETERVIAARRLSVLREFASQLAVSDTEAAVLHALERCLAFDARDLPFSLTYVFDDAGGCCTRRALTGLRPSDLLAPLHISPAESDRPWPIADALRADAPVTLVPLSLDADALEDGHRAWPIPPQVALILPIAQSSGARPFGAFIAGLNPYRQFDEAYRSFLELFVGQLAAGIASARAFDEERKRARALAEIDRAKTSFFSNVSHEFRTPLTLMLGPVEDMLQEESLARGRDRLVLVHRNGQRLLKLVNGLLDFSRIEAGRVTALYQPTDLARYTADLASVFSSAMEKAGLRYHIRCDALSEPVYVDRDMWEKIVLNLVSNAFKFTLHGEVRVTVERRDNAVALSVSDTGCGVPAEELPRLFERFHRVEGVAGRSHEGTGIGLALVQELVRLHGGSVTAASELGRGSVFTVTVPLGRAHIPPEHIANTEEVMGAGRALGYVEEALRWLPTHDSNGGPETTDSVHALDPNRSAVPAADRRHVLVADDNSDMRDYVVRLLSAHYAVEAVADGALALASAQRRRPSLILSDVMMPHLDGFGLVRAIRSDPYLASVPMILLSARAGEEATIEGMELGADDYLVKPFSARELLARVKSQIERAGYEQALLATQRQLEAALAAAKMAAWEWDATNDRIEVSETVVDVFGLRPDQSLRTSLEGFSLLHPDDVDRHRALVHGSLREGGSYFSQFRIIRPIDGELAWLEERGTAKVDRDTGLLRLVGVVMDITERKRGEDRTNELLQAERAARGEAERTARIKDEFLATLSHELRTPLNAIIGWAHLLAQGGAEREPLEEGLRIITRNARTQAQMIDDLLDMSRIISGKVRLDVQVVHLADVVSAAIDTVTPSAEAKDIELDAILDPHAGDVHGDPNRLQQVIWNLLSNAIKFTPKGGSISVVLKRVTSHLELSVTDTGQGIASDFLPHVFERFRQADASTTRRYGGLGLGLSIVKQLVELHGGTITADSKGPLQGSCFEISLPIAALRPHRPGSEQRERPATPTPMAYAAVDHESAPAIRGKRVLVVDDDRDARDVVTRLLSEFGATVIAADSAATGLASLEGDAFALVICDIGMPVQDGYDFIGSMRRLPPDKGGATPAIALTAFARPEDRRRALKAGYDMHLAKPVEPAELLAVCETLTTRVGWGTTRTRSDGTLERPPRRG